MTATAPIDKMARIARAAIDWVYNQTCSNALMELEDAVEDFMGIEVNPSNLESAAARREYLEDR